MKPLIIVITLLLLQMAGAQERCNSAQSSSQGSRTKDNLEPTRVPEVQIDAITTVTLPTGSLTIIRNSPALAPAGQIPELPPDLTVEDRVRFRERRAASMNGPRRKWLFISATVINESHTWLRWHDAENRESYEAWSNIDFRNLGGYTTFESPGTIWNVLLVTSVAPTRKHRHFSIPEPPPELEKFSAPSFIVVQGDLLKDSALVPIQALHDFYGKNSDFLIRSRIEREEVTAIRKELEAMKSHEPEHTVMWFRPGKGSRYLHNQNSQEQ